MNDDSNEIGTWTHIAGGGWELSFNHKTVGCAYNISVMT